MKLAVLISQANGVVVLIFTGIAVTIICIAAEVDTPAMLHPASA